MSILNLFRRKKKTGPEEFLLIPGGNETLAAFSGQPERGILIDMGDIVAELDVDGLHAHELPAPGIPVYTPEIYAASAVVPEARLLVDISALQTDGLTAAARELSEEPRLEEEFVSDHDLPAVSGHFTTGDQSAMIPAPERKRRYGHLETTASASKPDPFNDGIIIIGDWEHTEPSGVIEFDPGMNAADNWMADTSSPLLIIDKSVDLTLQSADQAAAAGPDANIDLSAEAGIKNLYDIMKNKADEYALSAEEYASLSNREIIDKVLAKWSKLETGHFEDRDRDIRSSNPDVMDKVIQELMDNILCEQHTEAII